MKQETKATFYLLLASIIWGFAFAFQVSGMEFMRPFTFNGITFLLGSFSLIPVILLFGKNKKIRFNDRKLLTYGLICGSILFFASNTQQFGIDITGSAGKAGFITGLYIIFVPVVGIFMKRRAGLFVWCAVVLSIVGMYFLCIKPEEGLGSVSVGDVLMLFSALFWTSHIITIDRFVKEVDPLQLAMIQFLVCGLLCTIAALITGEPFAPSMLTDGIVPILFRGVASIGVAYTCQVVGQRFVAPAKASVIFSLEAVFAAVGGALIINEIMTLRGYFGCTLILTGILLAQIPSKKKY
jgi:drug/metabolite transporter (DMT)-like permease